VELTNPIVRRVGKLPIETDPPRPVDVTKKGSSLNGQVAAPRSKYAAAASPCHGRFAAANRNCIVADRTKRTPTIEVAEELLASSYL
jgi:hypothetical protein